MLLINKGSVLLLPHSLFVPILSPTDRIVVGHVVDDHVVMMNNHHYYHFVNAVGCVGVVGVVGVVVDGR